MATFAQTSDVAVRPPGYIARRRPIDVDTSDAPRPTPLEWARRLRGQRTYRKANADIDRVVARLERLGPEWHFIDSTLLGLGAHQAFVAIGPGGIFAVTVVSQGRSRVLISGDVVQINGRRPDLLGEAKRLASAVAQALSRTAGITVPVVPVLTFGGTGLLSRFGMTKGCVVMPYRELDNLLRAYGDRLTARTVEKLTSIARHPATAIDLRADRLLTVDTAGRGRKSR